MSTPTLGPIVRTNGVAGQVSYAVDVTYDGEPTARVEFVGSIYGGPVVMVTEHGQTFVTEPSRFGHFDSEWVREFFTTPEDDEPFGPGGSEGPTEPFTAF